MQTDAVIICCIDLARCITYDFVTIKRIPLDGSVSIERLALHMNLLKAGFGRVNITPAMGIDLAGYFVVRKAEKVLDELEINAIALEAGGEKVVFLSIDSCVSSTATFDVLRGYISEVTGLPLGAIFVSLTHTHTAPILKIENEDRLVQDYLQLVKCKLADAARFALADLKPARMGWAVGNAPKVAFVRRFRMKDGKIRTNPGVGNPDILEPIGEVDERVNVLRFDQEGGNSIVLVNFGNHPDTVGGCVISADWPGFLRRRVEKALDNTRCMFINGAEGDVNHVNVNAKGGDYNDLAPDFDDVARGYGHARHMGNTMAGAVLQVFDKVNYQDVDSIRYLYKMVNAPSNMPRPEDMELAHRYNELHLAGKDSEIPFKGMELTTVVAEAGRMVRLENGPESFPLNLYGVAVGNVGFISIPGEGFTGIGRGLKEAEGYDVVLPLGLTNDGIGYFPMQEAYDEGGYEARSSNFKAGIAELIIDEGKKLLNSLR